MHDILELPENDKAFYRIGMQKLEAGKVDEGLEYLQKSLILEWQDDVFQELIQATLIFARVPLMKQLWATYFNTVADIAVVPTLIPIYIECLPHLQPFKQRLLTLTELKAAMREQNLDTEIVDEQLDYLKDLSVLQLQIETVSQQGKLGQWLANYFKGDPYEQLVQLKPLYELESTIVRPVFEWVLKSDTFLNFIKNDVLHYFIINGASGSVQYNWFGQVETLELSDLMISNEYPLVKEVKAKLLDYLEQDNPHMELMVLEYFTAQSMILFPYYERTGLTAEMWASQLIAMLGMNDESENVEQEINSYLMRAQFEYIVMMSEEELL
ncbi:hypothetical protein KBI51_01810 [Aerococcaceae bacterium zg-ZUI334]|uniref:hypothetical protein n=1 Tax=Aerococcaceae bacterium zg-252 TaxID=2796928 RepID=UPI001B92EBD5|nr:hypothetical protein [Aerococcaceae bacterium zg-ZUI334]